MRRPKRPSKAAPKPPQPDGEGPGDRLQKILAAAGHGSRRQAEELITAGRVEIDGKVVTQLGTRVDVDSQQVRVDGVQLRIPKKKTYALHKPRGVLSTNRDPSGRPRVIDLLPPDEHLFPVGRLDQSSEGLILVTNDGDLANQLTHPRYGVEKTYQVEVAGVLEPEQLARIKKGVHLSEGFARVVRVAVKTTHKNSTTLEMVLDEGRNREVRRILAKVGHKVMRLKRIAVGPLRLGELPAGHFRQLSSREVRELRDDAAGRRKNAGGEDSPKRKPPGKRRNTRSIKAAITERRPTVIGGDAMAAGRTDEAARPPRKPGASFGAKRPARAGARFGAKGAGGNSAGGSKIGARGASGQGIGGRGTGGGSRPKPGGGTRTKAGTGQGRPAGRPAKGKPARRPGR